MCVAVSDTIMRKKQAKIFFLYLAVFFVAYGGFVFQVHFSNDDYDFLFHQKEIAVTVASESYRNAMGVFYWVLDMFAINVVQNQVFFGILLIVSFAWSAAVLTMEMYRAAGQDSKIFLFGTGSLFMYLNAFACEWMWYAGAYIQWMVAMLTATYAAVFVAGSEKSRKKFLIGAGLLFLTKYAYFTLYMHRHDSAFFQISGEGNGPAFVYAGSCGSDLCFFDRRKYGINENTCIGRYSVSKNKAEYGKFYVCGQVYHRIPERYLAQWIWIVSGLGDTVCACGDTVMYVLDHAWLWVFRVFIYAAYHFDGTEFDLCRMYHAGNRTIAHADAGAAF